MRRAWIVCLALAMTGCRAASMEYWTVGQLELQMGNVDAAVENLEKCKRERPDFAPAYLALAAAKSKQGDFQSVAKNLNQYLQLEPQHHIANMYYAECMMTLGNYSDAEEYFNKYLATVPESESPHRTRLAHAHMRLAELAKGKTNAFGQAYHEAVALYQRGMESRERARLLPEPESAKAKQQAELVLAEAKQRLERLRNERPNDPRIRKYLADLAKPESELKASDTQTVSLDPNRYHSTQCVFGYSPSTITVPQAPVGEASKKN